MATWSEFAAAEPELAQWGAARFNRTRVAYIATVGAGGAPSVSPVTPVVCEHRLLLFVEPRSPIAANLKRDGRYALHSLVDHPSGVGGQFSVSGRVLAMDDATMRQQAVEASCYTPPDDYILFELSVESAQALDEVEGEFNQHWQVTRA